MVYIDEKYASHPGFFCYVGKRMGSQLDFRGRYWCAGPGFVRGDAYASVRTQVDWTQRVRPLCAQVHLGGGGLRQHRPPDDMAHDHAAALKEMKFPNGRHGAACCVRRWCEPSPNTSVRQA
jgi:hypothetical protein